MSEVHRCQADFKNAEPELPNVSDSDAAETKGVGSGVRAKGTGDGAAGKGVASLATYEGRSLPAGVVSAGKIRMCKLLR